MVASATAEHDALRLPRPVDRRIIKNNPAGEFDGGGYRCGDAQHSLAKEVIGETATNLVWQR